MKKLEKLAKRANTAHLQYKAYCKKAKTDAFNAIQAAVRCGKALLEAKKQLRHGSFMKWIDNNFFDKSHRSANVYMQIAQEWDNSYIQFLIQSRLGLKNDI